MKRQLNDAEKQLVRKQQLENDGSLRCFISGEIINNNDVIEYDHVLPYSKEGETDVANIRIVLKQYNRRKSDQSLYEVRDNLKLDKLFEQKKNNIKLQDIFMLKNIKVKNIYAAQNGDSINIDDSKDKKQYNLLFDNILDVQYFYGRVSIDWIENDDQEGLQPRVIDYKRLILLREHLKDHPQLAPSIARLVGGKLKLFDGQHKMAAQVLNNATEIDVKVYVSPSDPVREKKLFDDLMITNLDAHSKHKQVPFYTSTLLDRLSVIYREFLEEFISTKSVEEHTENQFINFLSLQKQYSKKDAKEILRSAIKSAAIETSSLAKYVAKASKDASFPMTVDLLNTTIFPNVLYLEPSNARFTTNEDFRDMEVENFKEVSKIIIEEAFLDDWVPFIRGKNLTNIQLKARRIWHKGSVLTWTPYLKSILCFGLQIMTNDEREKMLYRQIIDDNQKKVIKTLLHRLFNHSLWDEPEGEIDSLLVSARKQDELFNRKGLTEKYVIYGG